MRGFRTRLSSSAGEPTFGPLSKIATGLELSTDGLECDTVQMLPLSEAFLRAHDVAAPSRRGQVREYRDRRFRPQMPDPPTHGAHLLELRRVSRVRCVIAPNATSPPKKKKKGRSQTAPYQRPSRSDRFNEKPAAASLRSIASTEWTKPGQPLPPKCSGMFSARHIILLTRPRHPREVGTVKATRRVAARVACASSRSTAGIAAHHAVQEHPVGG